MYNQFNYDDETMTHQKPVPDAETGDAQAAPRDVPSVYSTRYYSQKDSSPPPPPPVRESTARERIRRKRHMKNTASEWAWVFVAAVLFAVVLVVSLSAFMYVRATQNDIIVVPTADIASLLPTPVVALSDFSDQPVSTGETLTMPDGSTIELVPWDGTGRFTVVVAGLDRRPNQTGLSYRTDTMMVVSIDPQTQSIGVLSLPRDLYVQVPGYNELQRINSPMVFGENRAPGYGPTLMMQTVQLNLGIRIHDYVVVDFQAFIDFIDAIGGITIDNPRTINDPAYPSFDYGYDPFYLEAGTHTLNGYDALRYARTRHGDSDIQRASRQQQVIYAVRERIVNADILPQLIGQAPLIWTTLQDNVYTGMSLQQVIQLALYVKDIPAENIHMNVIDYEYLRGYTVPSSGAQVLIPNRSRLGDLMVNTFGDTYSQ